MPPAVADGGPAANCPKTPEFAARGRTMCAGTAIFQPTLIGKFFNSPPDRQSTINNQQSTIGNRQSAIESSISTPIANLQSSIRESAICSLQSSIRA
jgi:hypothetical protein